MSDLRFRPRAASAPDVGLPEETEMARRSKAAARRTFLAQQRALLSEIEVSLASPSACPVCGSTRTSAMIEGARR